MTPKIFGKTLRRHRTEKHLTQEQLAEAADTALRYIQELEAGTKQPTITTLFKLAEALGTTPQKLIGPGWTAWKDKR
jgi:transcriptional regulator with XRE-family HTH domain